MTVAVLPVRADEVAAISERDIEWQATRGSGAGGQARNKTSNAVQMRHKLTGVAVRVESERSQHANRASAFRLLAARIGAASQDRQKGALDETRRGQVGTGMRGDKIRTVRMQDGRVVDHRTGKRTSFARYRAGHIEDLV